MSHSWKEINGLLTDEEIIANSDSTQNSINLVLNQMCYNKGYIFIPIIRIYTGCEYNIIANGTSTIVQIYVLKAPKIVTNSFKMTPNCSDGQIVYDSIDKYLEQTYGFSVIADGDNIPLLYQFGFNDIYFFHPHLLSKSFIDNIYLPEHNIKLTANVYDSKQVATASLHDIVLILTPNV